MNDDSLLKVINLALGALDILENHNISVQKLIDLKASKNGQPLTDEDVAKFRADAQAAIDAI